MSSSLKIQLVLKDYSSPEIDFTFSPDDVINVSPTFKASQHISSYTNSMFEEGRIAFAQSYTIQRRELIQDAIAYHEQIFGAIHP
jgi:protein TIF31